MESTVKKLPDSKIQLDVALDKEELLEYVKEAEKNFANEIRLEGFRRGKVPRELVRKHVGEQKIKEEALSIALRSSFDEAIKKEKLDVISQADFKILENADRGLKYTMVLSVFPEIILGAYTGLNHKKNPVSVTDAEVEHSITELVKMKTAAEIVERPAQTGDKVEVDFNIYSDGELIKGGKSENHPLVIGEKLFIPGFEEQIIGMEAGSKKNFSIKVPADYPQKEISGKEINIDLTLKKVEHLTSPKLDDGFARSLGGFASLAELKKALRQNLLLEKENKEKERVRLAIISDVVSKCKVEVPKTMVENRLDGLIRDFDEELHQKGMELGPYLAHLKKTQDELRADWRPRAQSQVKMSMAVRAIAGKEKIDVNENEISKEFAALADHYTRQGLLEELQKSDPAVIKSRIKDVLLNEKVFDFLEKNNLMA